MNWKKISIGCLILLVLLVAFNIFFLNSKIDNPVLLSSDQARVVDNFGYPTSFIITFGEMVVGEKYQPVRYEVWNYDQMGRRFYFLEGVFQRDVDIPFIDNVMELPIKPTNFKNYPSYDDFQKRVEISPTSKLEANSGITQDAKFYDFDGLLTAGVNNNQVIYIQAFPLIKK